MKKTFFAVLILLGVRLVSMAAAPSWELDDSGVVAEGATAKVGMKEFHQTDWPLWKVYRRSKESSDIVYNGISSGFWTSETCPNQKLTVTTTSNWELEKIAGESPDSPGCYDEVVFGLNYDRKNKGKFKQTFEYRKLSGGNGSCDYDVVTDVNWPSEPDSNEPLPDWTGTIISPWSTNFYYGGEPAFWDWEEQPGYLYTYATNDTPTLKRFVDTMAYSYHGSGTHHDISGRKETKHELSEEFTTPELYKDLRNKLLTLVMSDEISLASLSASYELCNADAMISGSYSRGTIKVTGEPLTNYWVTIIHQYTYKMHPTGTNGASMDVDDIVRSETKVTMVTTDANGNAAFPLVMDLPPYYPRASGGYHIISPSTDPSEFGDPSDADGISISPTPPPGWYPPTYPPTAGGGGGGGGGEFDSDCDGEDDDGDGQVDEGAEDCPEDECETCDDCPSDPNTASLNSTGARLNLRLGTSDQGQASASLSLSVPIPASAHFTPASLVLDEKVNDILRIPSSGTIEQVRTPKYVVDIQVLSGSSYAVRYYGVSQTNGMSSGKYTFTGSPLRTVTIQRPSGATDFTQMEVIDASGGGSHTHLLTYSSGTSSWVLSKFSGAVVKKTYKTWNSTTEELSEVIETLHPSTLALVQSRTHVYGTFDWGMSLVRQVEVNGSETRTKEYEYWTAAGVNYGKLKKVTRPEGGWSYYEYGANGLKVRELTGFKDQGYTTDASLCREIVTQYAADAAIPADDQAIWPQAPRAVIENLLGHEVSRYYSVFNEFERKSIRATSPGAAWNNTNNLVTVTHFVESGDFKYRPLWVKQADGRLTTYAYAINSGGVSTTTTSYTGKPDSGGTTVEKGTKSVVTYDRAGQVVSSFTYDYPSNLLIGQTEYDDWDSAGRYRRVKEFGTVVSTRTFSCCGVDTKTDRDGVVTTYGYDSEGRQNSVTRLGVVTETVRNVLGQVVQTKRTAGGTTVRLSFQSYDSAGRVQYSTNVLGGVTTNVYSVDGSGHEVTTVYHPNGGYTEQAQFKDRRSLHTKGTSANGMRTDYGVETIDVITTNQSATYYITNSGGGLVIVTNVVMSYSTNEIAVCFTKTIPLLSNGSDSSEWTKSYTDFLGRTYKTVHASASTPYPEEVSYYDSVGRLIKSVDADGVAMLYDYNDLGEPRYSAVDVNGNGVIDRQGPDRVSLTVSDVSQRPSSGPVVRRTRSYTLGTDSSTNQLLVSTSETSVDGLNSWTTNLTGVSSSTTAYGGSGSRVVTSISPDGTSSVATYSYGQFVSSAQKDTNAVTIASATYEYDSHGRQLKVIDARNGATVYTYSTSPQADLVVAVTSPSPGNGQSAQTSSTYYDNSLQAWRTQMPDGTSVTNEFYVTGQLKKTYGSRTYPVEYTYDYAGRMKTMKTWQGFTANTGAATTTWNYDSYRGWLSSKRYDDNKGPDYTYTAGGQLKTRQWARTGTGGNRITTTYNYGFDDATSNNSHGDLTEVSYSNDPQSTPTIAYTYDRLGLQVTAVNGVQTTTFTHNALGQPATESYSGSGHPLNNWAMEIIPDGYFRRGRFEYKLSSTLKIGTDFNYDAAGRLSSIVPGPGWVTFDYLPNSGLIGKVNFFEATISSSVPRMVTTRSYDKLNRLLGQRSDFVGQAQPVYSTDYAYNDANQRTRKFEADGSFWIYQYDSLGQVTWGKKYWSDGAPVTGQQFEYAFDDIGNRTSSKSGGDASGLNLRTAYYTNNALNQYIGRTNPGVADIIGAASPSSTVTVNGKATMRKGEYFWNEMSLTNLAGPTNFAVTVAATSASTNTGKLLWPAASEIPTYDDDGNLTSDSLWTYTWNAENQLVRMESSTNLAIPDRRRVDMTYDWMGRRIQKETKTWDTMTGDYASSGTVLKFIYDGWNVVSELDASNNLLRVYLWGPDLSGSLQGAGGVGGLLSMFDMATYKYQFCAYDGNGNVGAMVNQDGTVTARYEYGPFGELVRSSGSLAALNPFRFSTKYQDDESGYLYYGYRYYDSRAGTWINRDPKDETAFVTITLDTLNRVGSETCFLSNNALNSFDALGLETWTRATAIAQVSKQIGEWRGKGWVLAADLMQYFLSGNGPTPYVFSFSEMDRIMRWGVVLADYKDKLKALAWEKGQGTHSVNAEWNVNYYYPNNEAFGAFGGARLGVCGSLSVSGSVFSYSGLYIIHDTYVFVDDIRAGLPIEWAKSYRAAFFLQSIPRGGFNFFVDFGAKAMNETGSMF